MERRVNNLESCEMQDSFSVCFMDCEFALAYAFVVLGHYS